ncbi:MAG: tRNA lysidine(34) synthetase TilS [Chloracidobacterium sp.]|nr:tRNA lysidine(34) synthetase TilS [Chloracidobacterium sp.]
MTKFEKKLCEALRRFGIGEQDSIVAAISGGADSAAMLDAIARFQLSDGRPGSIIVAHLNHQLRGEESDDDEAFVRDLAGRLGLPICAERIAVAERAEEEKRNLEAMARSLRYEFLLKVAEARGANVVLTAHTLDDQAETILMRLIRGSGAEGLRGIHQIVALSARVNLLRPALGIRRDEVIEHCEHYGLRFRSDSSNYLHDFTRNRVRLEVLPLLETFNPRVKESLARASEFLVRDEDYLRDMAAEYLAAIYEKELGEESGLDVKALEKTPAAIKRRVLRLWLRAERGGLHRVNASHIAAIESILIGPSGRRVVLPGGASVAREFDRLRFIRAAAIEKTPELVELRQNEPRNFGGFTFILKRGIARANMDSNASGINASGIMEGFISPLRDCEELDRLWLRTRFPGAAYIPSTARRAVKLKTLMIRRKIPLMKRDRYPILVTVDDRIVWAPGLPVAREFTPNPEDEKYALIIAQRSEKSN